MKYSIESILLKYNTLKTTLGRIPLRCEFRKVVPKRQVDTYFGSYTKLQLYIGDPTRYTPFTSETKNCTICDISFNTSVDNKSQTYCSRSCANKITKLKTGKYVQVESKDGTKSLIKDKKCTHCESPINRIRSGFCSYKCWTLHRNESLTIGECLTPGKMASKYSGIRGNARNIAKYFKEPRCAKCGYDKHFEVCHIKSIGSFPLDTLMNIVNSPDNLVNLCPNCHWELDHL